METKNSGVRFEIKDEAKGTVDVVFSTFDVMDSDRDVTLPGAIKDGAPTRISAYGHQSWMGSLPVGKGLISTGPKEAVMAGQFFMDTPHGLDTFNTVKGMGDMQQWSYGYDPVEYSFGEFGADKTNVRFLKSVDVHEVSPVLLGAGVGTRTLSAKGRELFPAFKQHGTEMCSVLTEYVDRVIDISVARQKDGKSALSEETVHMIGVLNETLARLHGMDAKTAGPLADGAVATEFLRFQQFITTQGV